MIGMHQETGRPIEGLAHLRQSVSRILTTPLGTRVMRREFGSRLYDLVDHPLNATTRLAIIAATAEALITWEPRIVVEEVVVNSATAGSITIDLTGQYLPEGRTVSLEGLKIT